MMTPELAWGLSITLNIAGFLANLLYGNKSRLGPALWFIIAGVWIAYFVSIGQFELCVGPGLNIIIQARNFVKYCKDDSDGR